MSILSGKMVVITREFFANGSRWYYFIDVNSLEYGISDNKGSVSTNDISSSLLYSLFRVVKRNLSAIGDGRLNTKGLVLTTDLCPTRKGISKDFYRIIARLEGSYDNRFPLVIFFSGWWIRHHSIDIRYIVKTIPYFIAGNHTYFHHIIKNGEHYNTKMLVKEILNTEKIMLENHILPSFLFRFPGLSYRECDIKAVVNMSVLPISANLWMGMKWRNNAILLVHSNGMVDSEVKMFVKFMKQHSKGLFFVNIIDKLKLLAKDVDKKSATLY